VTPLSANFTLEEFLVSQTAERNDIDMTPTPAVLYNLKELVTHFMQPIRDEAGSPVVITSGFRPLELNNLIGGSKRSAHLTGSAADFHIIGQTPLETCEMIEDMDLLFDQLIHEFGKWVHLGIDANPRGEKLTAYRRDGHTTYIRDLIAMGELQHA